MKYLRIFVIPILLVILEVPFFGAYKADTPFLSSYIAPYERSNYFVDEGYHLVFYDSLKPLTLYNETSGSISLGFKLGGMFVYNIKNYYKKPEILSTYPDSFILYGEPLRGVSLKMKFVLTDSASFFEELEIKNKTSLPLTLFFVYENGFQKFYAYTYDKNSIVFIYDEPEKGHYFQQEKLDGFEKTRYLILSLSKEIYSFGGYQSEIKELKKIVATDEDVLNGSLNGKLRAVVFNVRVKAPVLYIYKKTVQKSNKKSLKSFIEKLKTINIDKYFSYNKKIFSNVPDLKFKNEDEKALFYSGLYLVRQQFLPPAGQFPYPYYVFSREPKWGWGHEGQVFHESLSMHALSIYEPKLAIGSQKNFMAVQDDDGYIPYRVGAFFTRTFPVKGEKTTSAPFFSWTNLTIYKVAKERNLLSDDELKKFLKEAYFSGKKYTLYLLKTRDKNKNGLLEWGGHTLLECVRDYLNAVFDMLGKEPDTLNQLEALDLSSMVVKEMKALSEMAKILGMKHEEEFWKKKANKMSYLINKYMWDEETGFYYHVHTKTMKFRTPDGKSLKRKEIIGFLPLWAGIASKRQAKRLIKHLTNKNEFFREFGIPTLSADDPYYDPQVLSCCRWNGPVWITWVYPVFRGVLEYGYIDIAEKIVDKMEKAMIYQLKKNHRLWESYSPDYTILYSPKNYIWDSLISKMIYDLRKRKSK